MQPADARGIKLPAGFTSRVVATAGSKVSGTNYTWHGAPDGGACFPSANGGWTYVSNSEKSSGAGGAGSITFNSSAANSSQRGGNGTGITYEITGPFRP